MRIFLFRVYESNYEIMSSTLQVFGVSNEIVGSYIEREQVDGFFQNALNLNKQIVVYGSSKQGKTSLIKKHLKLDNTISIQCSPLMNLVDVYSSVLRQNDIQILTESSEQETVHREASGSAKAKIKIPLIAEIEAGASGTAGKDTTKVNQFRTVEYNLSLAQDISEILKSINFQKYIILDNFHYLEESVQKQFAFDLRIFQETDIRFIILGIWRERNRLTQFNGDLQDRVVEVAVEPWEKQDFEKVLEKGSGVLNADFSQISDELCQSSFDSIGVFQELCKETCLAVKLLKSSDQKVVIVKDHLQVAIDKKLEDYSGRHLRSFETFADSASKSRYGQVPLFIPYYFLRVLLSSNFNNIVKGLTRKEIQQEITKIHHRPYDIRASDMSNFLQSITKYQIGKMINPPLFDYDRSINTLKIIDSTLYFFLRNCNREKVFDDITPPSDKLNLSQKS